MFDESLKLVFLRGINEDNKDTLNLIGGDNSKGPFDDILKVYRNYSRTLSKKPSGDILSIMIKSSNGVSKFEINNLLSNMKHDIISHLVT